MGRILAIDYGLKRTGLAIGSVETGIAFPWAIVDSVGTPEVDAKRVAEYVRKSDETFERIVVGLPLNMDGSTGGQAAICQKFGQAIGEILKRPVEYCDERLSSFAAEQKFRTTESRSDRRDTRGKKSSSAKPKRPLDAVAAAVILEGYLKRQRGEDQPTPSSDMDTPLTDDAEM